MWSIFARIASTLQPGPTGTGLQRLTLTNVVLDPTATPARVTSQTFAGVSPHVWTPNTEGTWLRLTLTNNGAFTLNATLTGLRAGQKLYLTVRNTIGGAAGAMTLGAAFKASDTTPTMPADTTNRTYGFLFDGTNLIEVGPQATADVPN